MKHVRDLAQVLGSSTTPDEFWELTKTVLQKTQKDVPLAAM
jgi:hypothetical protein